MNSAGDGNMMQVGNIDGQQVPVHICIQGIAFYGYVLVTGNIEKSGLYRVGGIAVVDDMDPFVYIIQEDQGTLDIYLSRRSDGLGGIAVDTSQYSVDRSIYRSADGIGLGNVVLQASGQQKSDEDHR
jgi:hypothetical protein